MSKQEQGPRQLTLHGKDAAIVIRENGLVEISIKMRDMSDRIDLESGELFIVALNALMRDKKWVDMVMNVDYPNIGMNRR